MRTRTLSISSIAIATALTTWIGCKGGPEARAHEAMTLVRSMHIEIFASRKKIITMFKALPESERIGMTLDGIKFYDIPTIFEESVNREEEILKKGLTSVQNAVQGEALIGELQLHTKNIGNKYRVSKEELELSLPNFKKQVSDGCLIMGGRSFPLDNNEKKTAAKNMVKIQELEIENLKEAEKIANKCNAKLIKLLH